MWRNLIFVVSLIPKYVKCASNLNDFFSNFHVSQSIFVNKFWLLKFILQLIALHNAQANDMVIIDAKHFEFITLLYKHICETLLRIVYGSHYNQVSSVVKRAIEKFENPYTFF